MSLQSIISVDKKFQTSVNLEYDINNVDKNTFNKGEMFKVLLPVNHSIEEGEFLLVVEAKLRTCPVYFGKAPEGMQNFALTADPYEDGRGSLKQTFSKNNSNTLNQ